MQSVIFRYILTLALPNILLKVLYLFVFVHFTSFPYMQVWIKFSKKQCNNKSAMLFNFYKCNQFNISLHALRITYTLIYILQYNLSVAYNEFAVHYLLLWVKSRATLICHIHIRFLRLLSLSIVIYIITQVILLFWLVLAYDLLKDRRTIDVIITRFSLMCF